MCNCGRNRASRQGPTVTVAPVQPTRTVRSAPPRATTLPRATTGSLPTVDPVIWGPPLWRILHILAEHTTIAQATAWPALLNALKTDIPCPDCRKHFTAWLRQHPYTLQPPRRYIMVDRKRVLAPPVDPQSYTRQWVLNLHNDVNRRSRKAPWNAEQVRDANQSLDAARAALQTLATLIGPGAHAQLTAMLPPVVVVEETAPPVTQPEEQPVNAEESSTAPVLVVEDETETAIQPPEDQQNQPLLVVEDPATTIVAI